MIATFSTLVHILRERAGTSPEQLAFTFLTDGDVEGESLTFAELDRRARLLSLGLRERGAFGERVLLCYPPGLAYVTGFFGCLYAGAIAVPAFPPDAVRSQRTLPRLRAILEDCGAAFLLTDAHHAPAARQLVARHGDAGAVEILTSDDRWAGGGEREIDSWRPPSIGAEDLAFLMYTSGSTGSPKGVMISHGNAVHNITAFHGFAERPCRTFVSWLPLFHDLGLVVATLYPVYRGAHCIMMSPFDFMQRPLRWLRALSRYRATTTAGPNFAYELCVRKIRPNECDGLDLSCLDLALNGAEPVRAHTLARFVDVFSRYGFRPEAFFPAYGLSDATADVSGNARFAVPRLLTIDRSALKRRVVVPIPSGGPDAVTLVGCGESLPGQRLLVVDPESRRECAAGEVGEIWLAGPSVAQGYWRNPDATDRSFGAVLIGEDASPRRYFRSGDLGFWHGGELFVIGRLDDMFIVHGENYFPEDIEPVVERCHPSLRPGCGAVFMASNGEEPLLTVVHEVEPARLTDEKELIRAIRRAVAEQHELEVGEVVLIAPGELLKTSSGKVRRRACREKLLSGELPVLVRRRLSDESAGSTVSVGTPSPDGLPAPPPPSRGLARAAAIETWLIEHFANRLGLPRGAIDVSQPFTAFGLPSVDAIRMTGELSDWLGVSVPPTAAWDHPSIERMVRHLAGEAPVAVVSQAAVARADEPIAIVGMGCRLPGAGSHEELWNLLISGRDAIEEVPKDRWNIADFYDPDPAAPGKMVSRWGGFLRDIDLFDAQFFEVTPREAQHIDPRQRLLLEVSWEALEDAGISRARLSGSNTGVFIAALMNDWVRLLEAEPARIDAYSGTGAATSALASRLSYFLDISGPSLTIDTACSGSLVAIHMACQSLRQGESEMALAGGVNLILLPSGTLFLSKAGMLAPDGRCKSFDHRANGLVRSDGAAVLVLKPLSAALESGDRVYAVIRGSDVNQDGRSDGMMAPSGAAQEALLRRAYRRAGIAPALVQYIEAHGAGTSLGDSIEARALGKVLGEGRPAGRPWLLGSLKTNIGHTEAVAGAAGVMKVALSLWHRRIPQNLHFERPNPLIPLAEMQAVVPERAERWPFDAEELVAGVSAFGLGGTNAHVVLSESPELAKPPRAPISQPPYLLPLSARTDSALRALAKAWIERLSVDATPLSDLVYTAQKRRSHFEHRLALLGDDKETLVAGLEAFLDHRSVTSFSAGSHFPGRRPLLTLVFSGEDRLVASAELAFLRDDALFRSIVEPCDRLFRALLGEGPLAAMEAASAAVRLDRPTLTRPFAFTVEVALAAMWRSYGVQPSVVVGDGFGAVAAAHVAGSLSLEDAAMIVAHASRFEEAGKGHRAELAEERVRTETQAALASVKPRRGFATIISTTTAEPVPGDVLDAAYWTRAVTAPSQFKAALLRSITAQEGCFLESGLDPELGGFLRGLLRDAGKRGVVLTSLRRGADPGRDMLAVAGRLYTLGHSLAWERITPRAGRCVSLPPYPWQRRRYWALSAASAPVASLATPAARIALDPPAAQPAIALSPAEAVARAETLFRYHLLSTSEAERPALLLEHLKRVVGAVLQIPPDTLVFEQPLRVLGIDSILLAEIRSRLEASLGVELPDQLVLDGPPLAELCGRILGRLA